jgi:hypothetical protein
MSIKLTLLSVPRAVGNSRPVSLAELLASNSRELPQASQTLVTP